MDSIFTIRRLFFSRKSIREYFMGKSGAFHGFFSYVGESRIITTPLSISIDAFIQTIVASYE